MEMGSGLTCNILLQLLTQTKPTNKLDKVTNYAPDLSYSLSHCDNSDKTVIRRSSLKLHCLSIRQY